MCAIDDNNQSGRDAQAAAQQRYVLLVPRTHVLAHQPFDIREYSTVVGHQLPLLALAGLDLSVQDVGHLVAQPQQLLRLQPHIL